MIGQFRNPYSVADYISDRKKKKQENQQPGTVIYNGLSNPKDILAAQKPVQQQETSTPEPVAPVAPVAPVQTTTVEPTQKTTTVTTTIAAAPQPTGVDPVTANANATKPLTQVDIARNKMEQARQKVYDVLNTKFQYNAKASPLYSILDRQYDEQARKAAGEAYARSVANTGGYGSSYATNTASEARRQVMEGFNDQQYALYQAAKDEFLTERQSAVDWYNMTKQMYNDVQNEELMSAYESAYGVWDGNNEDAVRAALTEQGVSATNINKIMTALKKEKLTNIQTDYSISEYEDAAAYKSAYKSASAVWTGDNESEVRTALQAEGVDAATVDKIIRDLKTGTLGDMTLDDELTAVRESREYKTAMNTARAVWAEDQSEEAVRAALSGYSATVVDDIVASLKQEKLTNMQVDAAIKELERTESGELTEESKKELLDAAGEIYDGTNKNQVETMLKDTGATDDEVQEIMGGLDEMDRANLDDALTQFGLDPTLSGAQEIMDYAKATGHGDEYSAKISEKLSKSFMSALSKPNDAYKVLEIDKEAWDAMSDDDKAVSIIEAASEAYKSEMLTADAFQNIVKKDMFNGLDEAMKASITIPGRFKAALDTLSGILALKNNGTIGTNAVEKLFDAAISRDEIQDYVDRWGSLIRDEMNNTQKEAYDMLVRAMYRTGIRKNETGDEIMKDITDRFSGNPTGSSAPMAKKR